MNGSANALGQLETGSLKRLKQGARALRPVQPGALVLDAALASLTPRQQEAFLALPSFDQSHLLRCRSFLVASGVSDPDLLHAALLHDLGKSSENARISTVDRTLRVLLRRLAPNLLQALANPEGPGICAGLVIAVHHPAIGAEQARQLGCNERVCWLIAHHEDTGVIDSIDLRQIQAADAAA